MTKFILAGGYPGNALDNGQVFLEEMVAGFDQPVRVLICLFARPEDTWQEVFEKDKLYFASKLRPKILLEIADPDRFIEQIKKNDIIYFRGGRTKKLLEMVKRHAGWEKELSDKTVAGTSAGANILGKYYYSLDDLEVCPGLGLLPVTVLVHYKSDYNAPNINWDEAHKELEVAGGKDMLVVTLAEGEFKVIEQSV